jgi:hypothetical protein
MGSIQEIGVDVAGMRESRSQESGVGMEAVAR